MKSSIDSPRISTTTTPLIGSLKGKTRSYIAFIWLGLGTLLPFNFFIIADPYYRCKLENPNQTNTSIPLEVLYENTVILCSSFTNLITVILVTFIFVPHIYKYRIYTSLIVIIICFLISFSIALPNDKNWRGIFFAATMILVMIQSVGSAILLNCLFSLASTLPSQYIQGFGFGQALGGILVSICSIISISVAHNFHSAMAIYFPLAIVVIISNIIVYYFLEKTHLFQIYSSSVQELNNEYEPFFSEASANPDENSVSEVTSLPIRQRLFRTYKQIKWHFLGVFITFVATFAVFPGYLSKIKSVHSSSSEKSHFWHDRLYPQVMTFLLFYIGDTFGRMISSKIHRPSFNSPRLLFFLCLTRFLFIFLFGFCNFPHTSKYPYLFKHDFIYALLVFIFAVSHGCCNSLNWMYAPQRVQTQLSGTVGALMMMALALGTFVGSSSSYGVVFAYGADKSLGGEHCQDF